jgi:hypothetical protein
LGILWFYPVFSTQCSIESLLENILIIVKIWLSKFYPDNQIYTSMKRHFRSF